MEERFFLNKSNSKWILIGIKWRPHGDFQRVFRLVDARGFHMSFPEQQISRFFNLISQLPGMDSIKSEPDKISHQLYKSIFVDKSQFADNIYNITNHHSDTSKKMSIATSTLEKLLYLEPLIRKRFNLLKPDDVGNVLIHLLKEIRRNCKNYDDEEQMREELKNLLFQFSKDPNCLRGLTSTMLLPTSTLIYERILSELISNFNEVILKELLDQGLA